MARYQPIDQNLARAGSGWVVEAVECSMADSLTVTKYRRTSGSTNLCMALSLSGLCQIICAKLPRA